jgi:hypothetical protein
MDFLEQQQDNEFLGKWIHGKLTPEELHRFTTSNLYKNLVSSSLSKKHDRSFRQMVVWNTYRCREAGF